MQSLSRGRICVCRSFAFSRLLFAQLSRVIGRGRGSAVCRDTEPWMRPDPTALPATGWISLIELLSLRDQLPKQASMNFKANESPEKLRGGFYTDARITDFLVRWVAELDPRRVLEPSCGDGAFFPSLHRRVPRAKVAGFELNEAEAEKASSRAGNASVEAKDFLEWYLFHGQTCHRFDAVVGNPPFIRYQYLPEQQQQLAERIFSQLRLPFTKHTNAWVPFVLASLELLRPGGRLAMVIPSEIFHIPHAQSLRTHLYRNCSRVLLVDPEEIWFTETLQGTVILMAEKSPLGSDAHGVGVLSVTDKLFLEENPSALFEAADYANGITSEGKWMTVFLRDEERTLLADLRKKPDILCFSELADVDVGIVTGANDFFLVRDSVVKEYGLSKWAFPMFGRSDHARGLVFSKADYAQNKKAGLPANFIWITEGKPRLPPRVLDYLAKGEAEGLPNRYKCSVRSPWYTVPSVHTAPVGMLKRAHHFPRLILNQAKAYTTDTAYRVQPIGSTRAEDLVFGFLNSLTMLSAELEGRHYGGGVLELVPSEIERLLVPRVRARKDQLPAADRKFREAKGEPGFIRRQDDLVLSRVGVGREECAALHGAWNRLRMRRQRQSATGAKAATN